jgi:beta-phosphoglucomutase-like phosphatase (HAD superfamily)
MQWLDTGYFWIEDHVNQAEAGHKAGLKAVLIKHPYNSHYTTDLFPSVSNNTPWKEIYNMVQKEYNT